MTVAPASAAVRTAAASVSTSPTPGPAVAVRRPKHVARLPDRRMDGVGCDPAERHVGGVDRCGADDAGDDRPVPVAVLGAVAGRHVVAAGEEVGQQAMPGDAGVDHRDGLAGAPRQPPHRLKFGEVRLSPATSGRGAPIRHASVCSVGVRGAGGRAGGSSASSTVGGVTAAAKGAAHTVPDDRRRRPRSAPPCSRQSERRCTRRRPSRRREPRRPGRRTRGGPASVPPRRRRWDGAWPSARRRPVRQATGTDAPRSGCTARAQTPATSGTNPPAVRAIRRSASTWVRHAQQQHQCRPAR